MKKLNLFSVIIVGMLLIAASVLSEELPPKEEQNNFKNQIQCPIMGGAIDSTACADIQGQRIYFCCPMCIEKFKKDPNEHFGKAAEDSILFENIQVSCPVSGKDINKEFFTYYEGRSIYFCSEKCIPPFYSNPAEHLEKPEKLKVEAEEKKAGPDKKHEMHDH